MTMSEDKTKHESELRTNKIQIIKLLADQMVQYKFNDYKDYKVPDDKPIAYYDATIDILKKQVKNAKLTQAKIIKFDQTEQERSNLTDEQKRELAEQQKAMNARVDSFLATIEPRASLRGNLQLPGNVIIRYRGKSAGDDFSKKYPFGVLI